MKGCGDGFKKVGAWKFMAESSQEDQMCNANDELCDKCNGQSECNNKFDEHIKRFTSISSYYFRDKSADELGGSMQELSTFIKIGAAAEKRRELQFRKMIDNLEQVSRNNKLLHFDNHHKDLMIESYKSQICENEEAIRSLTAECTKLKQKFSDVNKMKQDFDSIQIQFENANEENRKLHNQIARINKEYENFQELHRGCITTEVTELKMNKVTQLKELITNCRIEIKNGKEEIAYLTVENESLHDQICQITLNMEKLTQSHNDSSRKQDLLVNKLQSKVKALQSDLICAQNQLKIKNIALDQLKICLKNYLSKTKTISSPTCFRVENIQEIISRPLSKNGSVSEQNSIISKTSKVEDNIYIDHFVLSQFNEVNDTVNKVENMNEVELESVQLFDDTKQLHCNFSTGTPNSGNQSNDDISCLLRRIVTIKRRISAGLQREILKYNKSIRELCILRSSFAKIQQEIELFRSTDNSEHKGDIKMRILKEQELSQAISRNEKSAKFAKVKIYPLQKTLRNIEKMWEVVQHINS